MIQEGQADEARRTAAKQECDELDDNEIQRSFGALWSAVHPTTPSLR